jgi:hypothetical protein
MTAPLQMEVKAGRAFLFCPRCQVTVRTWPPGAVVPLPQINAADEHHRDAAHPYKLTAEDVRDAVGYDEDAVA